MSTRTILDLIREGVGQRRAIPSITPGVGFADHFSFLDLLRPEGVPEGVLPQLAWGRAEGATKGNWYRVNFPKAFKVVPSVVCTGLVRFGDFRDITVQKASMRSISPLGLVAGISPLARVQDIAPLERVRAIVQEKAEDMRRASADEYRKVCNEKFRGLLGDWTALNWVRDKLIWAMCEFSWFIGEATATVVGWIWDATIGRQLERVKQRMQDQVNAINERIDTIQDRLQTKVDEINDRMSKIRGELQSKVTDVNTRFTSIQTNVGTVLGDQNSYIKNSINQWHERFYETWGISRGVIPSPVPTRNITRYSFEWLSFGNTTIHWLAIAREG